MTDIIHTHSLVTADDDNDDCLLMTVPGSSSATTCIYVDTSLDQWHTTTQHMYTVYTTCCGYNTNQRISACIYIVVRQVNSTDWSLCRRWNRVRRSLDRLIMLVSDRSTTVTGLFAGGGIESDDRLTNWWCWTDEDMMLILVHYWGWTWAAWLYCDNSSWNSFCQQCQWLGCLRILVHVVLRLCRYQHCKRACAACDWMFHTGVVALGRGRYSSAVSVG